MRTNETGATSHQNIFLPAHNFALIIAPLLILVISRLLPFFHWGEFPLGADAGIYIKKFQPYLSPDFIYSLYIYINVLVGLAIYYLTYYQFGKRAAVFSFFIFSLSLTQFLTYWVFYGKMMVAMLFSLICFYFIYKQSWFFIWPAIVVAIVHPPTAAPLLMSFFLYALFKQERLLWLKFTILVTAAIAVIGPDRLVSGLFYLSQYLKGNSEIPKELLSGHFVDFNFYQGYLSLFYLPVGLAGLYLTAIKKRFDFLFFYSITTFALIFSNFIFYNRYIILLDLVLIIFSGLALATLYDKIPTQVKIPAAIVLLAMLTFQIFHESWRTEPLVNLKEILEMKRVLINNNEPIVINDPRYFPIISAYTNRPIVEVQSLNDLASVTEPFLLYQGRRTIDFNLKDKKMTRISDHFWIKKISTNTLLTRPSKKFDN